MSQPRIILSFLGTGNYQKTNYKLDDKVAETQFFAQALCTFYPDYQLKVVMTNEAKKCHDEALQQVCAYEVIDIPSGKNEAELWEMFAILAEKIPKSARLIVDVTHGFRSQPMLALAACVYLRTVKDVKVEQIIYGAWEAKDAQGTAPVFDLTSFLSLIDWSVSAQQFMRYGNAAPMRDLLQGIHIQTHKNQKEYRAKGLTQVGERLADFSNALAMIRPQEVLQHAEDVPNAIEKAQEDLENLVETRPFSLLLEKVNERVKPYTRANRKLFTDEGFKAQAAMIRLYLSTEQYTQAVTLAREAITSKICVDNGYDPFNQNHRQGKANKNISKLPTINELAGKAKRLRDDLNHAGMKETPKEATEALKELNSVCEEIANIITQPTGSLKFSNDNH